MSLRRFNLCVVVAMLSLVIENTLALEMRGSTKSHASIGSEIKAALTNAVAESSSTIVGNRRNVLDAPPLTIVGECQRNYTTPAVLASPDAPDTQPAQSKWMLNWCKDKCDQTDCPFYTLDTYTPDSPDSYYFCWCRGTPTKPITYSPVAAGAPTPPPSAPVTHPSNGGPECQRNYTYPAWLAGDDAPETQPEQQNYMLEWCKNECTSHACPFYTMETYDPTSPETYYFCWCKGLPIGGPYTYSPTTETDGVTSAPTATQAPGGASTSAPSATQVPGGTSTPAPTTTQGSGNSPTVSRPPTSSVNAPGTSTNTPTGRPTSNAHHVTSASDATFLASCVAIFVVALRAD